MTGGTIRSVFPDSSSAPGHSDQALPHVDCSIVIVTYNSADDIPQLFESLADAAREHTIRTVVVDNCSTDDTLETAKACGATLVIDSEKNLGYSGGINLGRRAAMRAGPTDSFLVLNPDLRLEPEAIDQMFKVIDWPGVGAVVPRLTNEHGDTLLSLGLEPSIPRAFGEAVFGARFAGRPNWLSERVREDWAYEQTIPVDWAFGAAILVTSDVDEMVGDWDETYFMYSEEVDYARRVRATGLSVMYAPAAVAFHSEGGSGRSPELGALKALNRVRDYAKLHGRLSSAVHRLIVIGWELLRFRQPGRLYAARVVAGVAPPPSFPDAPPVEPVPW